MREGLSEPNGAESAPAFSGDSCRGKWLWRVRTIRGGSFADGKTHQTANHRQGAALLPRDNILLWIQAVSTARGRISLRRENQSTKSQLCAVLRQTGFEDMDISAQQCN